MAEQHDDPDAALEASGDELEERLDVLGDDIDTAKGLAADRAADPDEREQLVAEPHGDEEPEDEEDDHRLDDDDPLGFDDPEEDEEDDEDF